MSRILREDIKAGKTLVCTRASSGGFYSFNSKYYILKVDDEDLDEESNEAKVYLTDDTNTEHSWCIASLMGTGEYLNWSTQFKADKD